jgi:hypothetical protein
VTSSASRPRSVICAPVARRSCGVSGGPEKPRCAAVQAWAIAVDADDLVCPSGFWLRKRRGRDLNPGRTQRPETVSVTVTISTFRGLGPLEINGLSCVRRPLAPTVVLGDRVQIHRSLDGTRRWGSLI